MVIDPKRVLTRGLGVTRTVSRGRPVAGAASFWASASDVVTVLPRQR